MFTCHFPQSIRRPLRYRPARPLNPRNPRPRRKARQIQTRTRQTQTGTRKGRAIRSDTPEVDHRTEISTHRAPNGRRVASWLDGHAKRRRFRVVEASTRSGRADFEFGLAENVRRASVVMEYAGVPTRTTDR